MRYCTHCGTQIHDEAVICMNCGCSVGQKNVQTPVTAVKADDTMNTVIKIFLILGCISQGWLLLPLAWCIPITVSIFNAIRDRRPISTGLKVCALLLVNTIAGICLLCKDDNA